MAGMIEVHNLSKTFATKDANVEALQDINLSIQEGDIYGIIGMSGAGKATALKILEDACPVQERARSYVV